MHQQSFGHVCFFDNGTINELYIDANGEQRIAPISNVISIVSHTRCGRVADRGFMDRLFSDKSVKIIVEW
jgi:hypothetical protein